MIILVFTILLPVSYSSRFQLFNRVACTIELYCGDVEKKDDENDCVKKESTMEIMEKFDQHTNYNTVELLSSPTYPFFFHVIFLQIGRSAISCTVRKHPLSLFT